MLAIVFSLCSYTVTTWASQSFWLFNIAPKNFPFLCKPPSRKWGGQPQRWVGTVSSANLHKSILGMKGEEGGRVLERGGTE